MPRRGGAMHLATTRRHYVGKDGQERVYETHLLRRSYREDGKVKNETLANLSHLPAATIDLVRASLDGAAFVPATGVEVARSLPHGQVAAVWAQARGLGRPSCSGRPGGCGTSPSRCWWRGWSARRRRWPPAAGGPTAPWPSTWRWPTPPATRCTPRWTGW